MKQILFLLGHLCNRRQQDAEHWVLGAAYRGVMTRNWLHFGLDRFFFWQCYVYSVDYHFLLSSMTIDNATSDQRL
jgi:hypothetical protein